MSWLRPIAMSGTILALAGCAMQVASNAVDMNASYRGLLTKQILYNLGQAIEDPAFFPSQIVVNGGQTESLGTVTPSVALPLPATTLANAVAAGAATTVTNTSTTAVGNFGFTLGASAQSKFVWTLVTKNDPDEMRRLRALYLYAVGKMPASCQNERGEPLNSMQDCFKQAYTMQGSSRNVNQIFTDRPSCVLCGSAADQSALQVNERLRPGFVRTSPAPGFRFLVAHEGKQFFVPEVGGEEAFVEFVLFVLEAISNSTAFWEYKPPASPTAARDPRAPTSPPAVPFVVPRSPAPGKFQAPPPIFVQPL